MTEGIKNPPTNFLEQKFEEIVRGFFLQKKFSEVGSLLNLLCTTWIELFSFCRALLQKSSSIEGLFCCSSRWQSLSTGRLSSWKSSRYLCRYLLQKSPIYCVQRAFSCSRENGSWRPIFKKLFMLQDQLLFNLDWPRKKFWKVHWFTSVFPAFYGSILCCKTTCCFLSRLTPIFRFEESAWFLSFFLSWCCIYCRQLIYCRRVQYLIYFRRSTAAWGCRETCVVWMGKFTLGGVIYCRQLQ